MSDHDIYDEAVLIPVQDIPRPPEFDQVLAYQGKQVRPPSGQGSKRHVVLGVSTRQNGQGGVDCFALLHGHEAVPCQEFLENWRLPNLN
tara:strand:+ start:943 stop:1209 length:267 start_codon:yes stop_codon:yes gene_type:complete